MIKTQPWIILFALIVLGYGLSQYWEQQRSNQFQAILLDFLPKQVSRINIQEKDQSSFSIIRNDERWLLSSQNINETASTEAVESLLKRLRDIRTAEIVAHDRSSWEDYNLGPNQGVSLCLDFEDKASVCIRIGRYAFSEGNQQLEAYTRLEDQEEIYNINGLSLSFLDGNIDHFRRRQLINTDRTIHQLRFLKGADTTTLLRQGDLRWYQDGNLVADSTYWDAYVIKLKYLTGRHFADEIDELALDSLQFWQLLLYQGGDSISLSCYQDTSRARPFILHSSQFTQVWIESDSNGLHQELIIPWTKQLSNNE